MKTKILQITMLIAAFLFSGSMSFAQLTCDVGAKKVLVIGQNFNNVDRPGDDAIRTHLETLAGLTVEGLNAEDVTAEVAITYDLIIVSSTIASDAASILADIEVPVICHEAFAIDAELKMAIPGVDFKTYANVPFVDQENSFSKLIVTAEAPDCVTGGLTGEIDVFTGNVPFVDNSHVGVYGVPNDNAIKILEYKKSDIQAISDIDESFTAGSDDNDFGDNTRYAAFLYPKGVQMGWEEGFTAPDIRGMFFFHDNTAAVAGPKAWQVYDAMISYCLGCQDCEVNAVNDFAKEKISMFIYRNINMPVLSLRVEKPGEYMIDVFNLLGKRVFTRTLVVNGERELGLDLNVPAGLYMLNVSDMNGNTKSIKFFR